MYGHTDRKTAKRYKYRVSLKNMYLSFGHPLTILMKGLAIITALLIICVICNSIFNLSKNYDPGTGV